MKTNLTQETIQSYQDNGFVVIEHFLNSKELARWRRVTDKAVRDRMETHSGMENQGDPDAYYAQVFLQCVRLIDTNDEMRELILDPKLGEVAGRLAGVDGVRIWHDQALIKQAFANPTGWHLDNPYWSYTSRDAISVWVALDDATLGNGCLWYIPGSHKTARIDNSGIGPNMADLFKVYPEWREVGSVACPCRAGAAVFHNGLTAHAAGANMTNGQRRAMTCGFMPDGSTFNGQKNILPDDYFNSLKVGDVLNNDELYPVVWSREKSG